MPIPIDKLQGGSPAFCSGHLVHSLPTLRVLQSVGLAVLVSISGVAAALDEMYFVDNSATGPSLGTQANPYRTIQEGVNRAGTRDTVVVIGDNNFAPRQYPERVNFSTSPGGTDVTLIATPRRSVTTYGFRTGGAGDRLTIESFKVSIPDSLFVALGAQSAIFIDSDYVEIRDNNIALVPGWAIRSSDDAPLPVGGHVVGNFMYRCGAGISIFGNDWLIEWNEVWRNVVSAVAVGIDADYSRAFGSDITFRYNYFHGSFASETGTSHVDGFQFFDHNGFSLDNFVFENNMVSECGQGVIITSRNRPSDNIIIRGNVFEGNIDNSGYTTSTGILVRGQITNFVATNNIVANVRFHGINTNEGMEALVQNNILYNAGTNYRASADAILTGGFNLINVPSNRTNIDSNDLVGVDPMFLDPGNWLGADGIPFTADDGGRLRAGSPALNAATNLGASVDIAGVVRPQNGSFDIGPYERDGADPLNMWVDFAFDESENENGTVIYPFDTLAESLAVSADGGQVNIRGDSAVTLSGESLTIDQSVTLRAVNGTVVVGATSRASEGGTAGTQASGFVSRD